VAASILSFTFPEVIHENFKRDLKIPWEDSLGNEYPLQTVVAMLDTASHGGNWVRYELLQDLNKMHLMTDISPGAHIVRTGNGQISAVGRLSFDGNRPTDTDTTTLSALWPQTRLPSTGMTLSSVPITSSRKSS
jgi:hypothetical protein